MTWHKTGRSENGKVTLWVKQLSDKEERTERLIIRTGGTIMALAVVALLALGLSGCAWGPLAPQTWDLVLERKHGDRWYEVSRTYDLPEVTCMFSAEDIMRGMDTDKWRASCVNTTIRR
jgi:hypothetical protein